MKRFLKGLNATIVIDPGHGGEDPGAVVNFSRKHEARSYINNCSTCEERT